MNLFFSTSLKVICIKLIPRLLSNVNNENLRHNRILKLKIVLTSIEIYSIIQNNPDTARAYVIEAVESTEDSLT
jgi:hypothetical protein